MGTFFDAYRTLKQEIRASIIIMMFRASQEQPHKLDDTILTYFHACAEVVAYSCQHSASSLYYYNAYYVDALLLQCNVDALLLQCKFALLLPADF